MCHTRKGLYVDISRICGVGKGDASAHDSGSAEGISNSPSLYHYQKCEETRLFGSFETFDRIGLDSDPPLSHMCIHGCAKKLVNSHLRTRTRTPARRLHSLTHTLTKQTLSLALPRTKIHTSFPRGMEMDSRLNRSEDRYFPSRFKSETRLCCTYASMLLVRGHLSILAW